jgi:hypothetical protein
MLLLRFPIGDFAEGIERLHERERQVAKNVHTMDVFVGIRIIEGLIFADLAHLAPPDIGDHAAEGDGIELRPAVAVGLIFLLPRQGHVALGGLDLGTVLQGHDGELLQSQHRSFGAAGRQWRQQENQAQSCSPHTSPKNHIPLLCSGFTADSLAEPFSHARQRFGPIITRTQAKFI